MHYEVSDSIGNKIANTDHFLNLYNTNQRDANGRLIQFYSQLSLSEVNDAVYLAAKTTEMYNVVDMQRDNLIVSNVSPTSTLSLSGSNTYSIGVGIEAGVTANIGTTIGGGGGEISPDGDILDYGANGAFEVQFAGSRDGTTSLPGAIDVRGPGYSRRWKTYVGGTSVSLPP